MDLSYAISDNCIEYSPGLKIPYLDDIADYVTPLNKTFCVLTLQFETSKLRSMSREVLELFVGSA